ATATDTATLPVTNVTPTITVDKTAPATIAEGNTVTYSFAITNTSPASTDPVTITSVIDNVLGNLTAAANPAWLAQGNSGSIVLDQNASFTFSFTTTTALNAGPVTNTVTVSGRDDENTPTSDTDTATVTVTNVTPTLAVVKSGPLTIDEGSTVTYGF